jgi:hypothetical protein
MKSVLRYTAAGLALATVGIASNASAATDTASATAEILSTLQVNVDATEDTLDFGDIADDGLAASSNVTVSPTGVLTCGTDLLCSGTAAAPLVHVTGLPSSQVAISFPNASVALTTATVPTGMSGSMTLGTFVTDAPSNQLTLTGGTASFHVGGTLTVNQLQAPGVYVGTFPVQVLYN